MPDTSLREAIEELMRLDPVLWAVVHRRIRGAPLIFDNTKDLTPEALGEAKRSAKNLVAYNQDLQSRLLRHRPFLVEPMRDQHPHKSYQKARQMGVSEEVLNEETHFLSNNPGTKAIHAFPRDLGLRKFVTTRVDPAFEETPRMRSLLSTPNGVYLKRVKDAFLILTSAWDHNLGEGVDADMVTLDEKDKMNQGVDMAFRMSLKSSKWALFREVSTPTLPTTGVARTYALSDKREWFVRCTKCGLKQPILYPDNIIEVKPVKSGTKELEEGSYEYLCRKDGCRGKLDRMTGWWIAGKPSVQNIRGYHMSLLMCPWMTATQVMQERINLRFVQLWYNYVLGLPSQGESVLISDADLDLACAGHDILKGSDREIAEQVKSDWYDIVATADWGVTNWFVVTAKNRYNNRRYVIGIKWFDDDPRDPLTGSAKAAEAYFAPFAPDVMVCDDGFGKDRNAYLLKKFDGTGTQFWACRYSPAQRNTRQFQPVWSEVGNQVLVDRTMWLKQMCREIKTGEVGLPDLDTKEGQVLKTHILNLVPQMEEIEDLKTGTKEIVETIASKGPDHLAHCLLYSALGATWLEKNARLGLITDF